MESEEADEKNCSLEVYQDWYTRKTQRRYTYFIEHGHSWDYDRLHKKYRWLGRDHPYKGGKVKKGEEPQPSQEELLNLLNLHRKMKGRKQTATCRRLNHSQVRIKMMEMMTRSLARYSYRKWFPPQVNQ